LTRSLDTTSVTDPDHVAPRVLIGWRPRVYRLHPGPLHLTRRYLQLAAGVSAQETRLLTGGLRIDGHIGPGMLKIGFVRSSEIRILGSCVREPFMALAGAGGRLNFSTMFPGSALTLHLDQEVALQAISANGDFLLTHWLQGGGGPETLLRPVTRTGGVLEKLLRRLLAREKGESGAAELIEAEEVIAASARLIEEFVGSAEEPFTPSRRRRDLALTVEGLLWEAPEKKGRFSLDDAARRLKCSRRSIQLALQEEFGLGFVALKRSIRLQQVHAILRRNPEGAAGIGRIAKAHEFNHLGRFAGHYREMFGVLPSLERPEGAGAV
jgi:AraC-like DNA-binding protein